MTAIQRLDAHQTLTQLQAIRLAAWGDAEDVQRFQDALLGKPVVSEVDAALTAFGVSPAGETP